MIQIGYNTFYPEERVWFKTKEGRWIEAILEIEMRYGEMYSAEITDTRGRQMEWFGSGFELYDRLSKVNPGEDGC